MNRHPTLVRLLVRLLIAGLSICLFLGSTELVLRLARVSIELDNLYFLLNPELSYPEYFLRDHRLFWKFRPKQVIKNNFMVAGEYRINSYGMRNQEFKEQKKADIFRIICLGNSNTFGWKQREESAYPQRLQKLLEAKFPFHKVEVINAGITGYSSYQGKSFLRQEILKFQPDLITVNYGWNDLLPAKFGIEDKNQKLPPQIVLDVQNLLSRTQLYKLLKSLWVGRISKPEFIKFGVSRVSLSDFQKNLTEIEEICQQNQIKVLFLTFPIASAEAFWGPGKITRFHLINQAYNHSIREFGEKYHFQVLDLAALFNGRKDLYDDGRKDYIHYNTLGHEVVARGIYDYLLQKHIITPQG